MTLKVSDLFVGSEEAVALLIRSALFLHLFDNGLGTMVGLRPEPGPDPAARPAVATGGLEPSGYATRSSSSTATLDRKDLCT